jgi:hypothetical protein
MVVAGAAFGLYSISTMPGWNSLPCSIWKNGFPLSSKELTIWSYFVFHMQLSYTEKPEDRNFHGVITLDVCITNTCGISEMSGFLSFYYRYTKTYE